MFNALLDSTPKILIKSTNAKNKNGRWTLEDFGVAALVNQDLNVWCSTNKRII
uniref:Uncharacterized protein n=1 Tax=Rhizophagus irregularis (strain DAOM 181602 / DAOM 197198 / MUCL 43194) TaxID=747089 RepID=U9SN11_RHIID